MQTEARKATAVCETSNGEFVDSDGCAAGECDAKSVGVKECDT